MFTSYGKATLPTMAVTIRDVAQRGRSLPGNRCPRSGRIRLCRARIAPARILAAARDLGYLPNNAARTLASGTSNLIGFVTADIENSFLRHGVERPRGRRRGVRLHPHRRQLRRDARPRTARRRLAAGQSRGRPCGRAGQQPRREHISSKRPRQACRSSCSTAPCAASLSTRPSPTARAGATPAVEHLSELGHRRIGIVTDSAEAPMSSSHRTCCGAGPTPCAGAGIMPSDSLIVDRRCRSRTATRPPSSCSAAQSHRALSYSQQFMTIGALRAFRELGIEIPTDLSLVAFDDFEVLALFSPPVTAVAQPEHQLGGEAGRLLLARMQGDSAKPRRLRLSTELIVRASTARLRQRPQPARPVGAAALSKMAAFRAAAAGS